jgi:hypothetical protein
MRNRAKCKLCDDIIESFHRHDYVTCKCGHISVDGGNDYHRCRAGDWANFLRVDDEGNTIVPKIVDAPIEKEENEALKDTVQTKITTRDKLDMLHEMIKNIEKLPAMAQTMPITNYDLSAALLLLLSILRDICKEES